MRERTSGDTRHNRAITRSVVRLKGDMTAGSEIEDQQFDCLSPMNKHQNSLTRVSGLSWWAGFFVVSLFIVMAAPRAAETAVAGEPKGPRDTLKVGDEAPTFVVLDAQTDEPVYLRDFTGKELRTGSANTVRHAVVVSFWASWCEPCKTEIPLLTKMALEFKNEPVKIFLMNTGESLGFTADSVRALVKSRKYTLPCLVDNTGMVSKRYTVRGLPMIVVIDKFGVVRKVNRGYHENFHLEISQLLRQLVKEDKPLQN